jgi:hypothetical protein
LIRVLVCVAVQVVCVVIADAVMRAKRDDFYHYNNDKHRGVTLELCVLRCIEVDRLSILLYGYYMSKPFRVKIRRSSL